MKPSHLYRYASTFCALALIALINSCKPGTDPVERPTMAEYFDILTGGMLPDKNVHALVSYIRSEMTDEYGASGASQASAIFSYDDDWVDVQSVAVNGSVLDRLRIGVYSGGTNQHQSGDKFVLCEVEGYGAGSIYTAVEPRVRQLVLPSTSPFDTILVSQGITLPVENAVASTTYHLEYSADQTWKRFKKTPDSVPNATIWASTSTATSVTFDAVALKLATANTVYTLRAVSSEIAIDERPDGKLIAYFFQRMTSLPLVVRP